MNNTELFEIIKNTEVYTRWSSGHPHKEYLKTVSIYELITLIRNATLDEAREDVILYQQTLEKMVDALCSATGAENERYDTDQADIACYEDCFNEMAGLLKRAKVRFDDNQNDFVIDKLRGNDE